ncbi:MAG: hypothetical protein HEP70_05840 [Rhodobiaceae bacterium]|nr:hypothetical protein [Rhodobiaceae bacterium]
MASWLIVSSVLPLKELLLISAPYMLGRIGGYLYWLARGRLSGEPIFWRGYQALKPEGFWVPSIPLLMIQFWWMSLVVIVDYLLDGLILTRLGFWI